MFKTLIFMLAILAGWPAGTANAADSQNRESAAPAVKTQSKSLSFDDLTRNESASDASPCAAYAEAVGKACQDDLKASFDHHRWKLEYTQKAYEAHHIYTLFVFVLVCSMVLLGMWLSYAEFQKSAQPRRISKNGKSKAANEQTGDKKAAEAPNADATTTPQNGEPQTQLQLSSSGVTVTSPVLGVIILIVSMGFFYLYLKTVYPIEESQSSATQTAPAAEAAKGGSPAK